VKPELLVDSQSEVGEGPSWDGRTGTLLWVDITAGLVHSYDPGKGTDTVVGRGRLVSCVVPRKAGGLAVTLQDGFYSLDPKTGRTTPLAVVGKDPRCRFNDGKCDPVGRFWAGTMDIQEKTPRGALYRFEHGGKPRRVIAKVTVSNGLGWSPDEGTMYYIDSPTRRVSAFDYRAETGEIRRRRTVVDFSSEPGEPDGMAVDAEGMIWVAHWGGWRITRFDPEKGKAIEHISFPASQVASCCFGGRSLQELYVTTARIGLDADAVTKQPLAGGLFRLKTNVKGLPTNLFEG